MEILTGGKKDPLVISEATEWFNPAVKTEKKMNEGLADMIAALARRDYSL